MQARSFAALETAGDRIDPVFYNIHRYESALKGFIMNRKPSEFFRVIGLLLVMFGGIIFALSLLSGLLGGGWYIVIFGIVFFAFLGGAGALFLRVSSKRRREEESDESEEE